MNHRRHIHCSDCGASLGDKVYSEPEKLPCPKCGSEKRSYSLFISDDSIVQLKESVRIKAKDSARSGKDKLRKEVLIGDDLHRQSGRWYKKERIIDKENNRYKEVVVDPQTGEIIHYCEEALSAHRDHGSAKRKSSE